MPNLIPKDVVQTLITKLDLGHITPIYAKEHAKRNYGVTLDGRTRNKSSALSRVTLSYEELCHLSRVFNRGANLGDSRDLKINEWLKQRIAAAHSNAPTGSANNARAIGDESVGS